MKPIKKKYRIYMIIDGQERVLTDSYLREVPVSCKYNPALYNLMEGIKIGVVFSNKNYKSLDFRYEEIE